MKRSDGTSIDYTSDRCWPLSEFGRGMRISRAALRSDRSQVAPVPGCPYEPTGPAPPILDLGIDIADMNRTHVVGSVAILARDSEATGRLGGIVYRHLAILVGGCQINRVGRADQSGCLHFRSGKKPTEVLRYYVDLTLETVRRVQPYDKPTLKMRELARQPACTVGGRVRCASRSVDGGWYAQFIHTHLPQVPARGSRTRWASGAGTPVHMRNL